MAAEKDTMLGACSVVYSVRPWAALSVGQTGKILVGQKAYSMAAMDTKRAAQRDAKMVDLMG